MHAGDMLLLSHTADALSLEQLKDFNDWLAEQPHPHKICIGGNHDGALVALGKDGVQKLLSAATYLEDNTVEVLGLRIHGSPLSTGKSANNAFQAQGGYDEIGAAAAIPSALDILLTHGPPGK